jgi:hypothetical protein
MGRSLASFALWLMLLLSLLLGWAVMASADRAHDNGSNKTSSLGALFWSTAKEEVDLLRNPQAQEDSTEAVAYDDSDGGFSSLEGMLQWAIGNFIRYFSYVPIYIPNLILFFFFFFDESVSLTNYLLRWYHFLIFLLMIGGWLCFLHLYCREFFSIGSRLSIKFE